MKVGTFSVPTRSDIPGLPREGPASVDNVEAMLRPRDNMLKEVVQALNNQVTFDENMSVEIRDLTVAHNTEYTVQLQTLRNWPKGVLCVYNSLNDYVNVAWRAIDTSTIAVKFFFESVPSGTWEVRILIF